LGTPTAHCNHVGQSSIFVTLLFLPSASNKIPRELRGHSHPTADPLRQPPSLDLCAVYDKF
jgi:hypothetical protein